MSAPNWKIVVANHPEVTSGNDPESYDVIGHAETFTAGVAAIAQFVRNFARNDLARLLVDPAAEPDILAGCTVDRALKLCQFQPIDIKDYRVDDSFYLWYRITATWHYGLMPYP